MSDYRRAVTWYARLLGSEPAFLPNATEAVWELAPHRFLYVDELPARAGHAMHTEFVDVALARAAGVEAITSGDDDLHAATGLGVEVLTPSELLTRLGL